MQVTHAKLVAPAADLAKAKEIRATAKSTAEAVRALAKLWGATDRGRIARALEIRYQWVRNVLITPTAKK